MRVMQVKYNARTKMNKANSRLPFSLAVTKGNEGSCYSNPVYQADISAGIITSQSGPTNMCSDYQLIQKAPSNQQSYGLYLKRATMGLGAGGGGIGNAKSSAGLASRVVGLPFTDSEFNRGQQQRTLTYKRPPNFTTSNYIDNKRSKALRCNILDKCRKPEKITIKIDGTSQVIYLYSNYNNLANSVSNLNSQINVLGATASIDGGVNLKITSNSTGSSSKVSIVSDKSDSNPIALFGSAPSLTTGIDATAGTLTGGSFTSHDFSTVNENLNVIVDGGNPESITISADCNTGTPSTDLDNAAAGISITGATVSVDSGNLKITSNSTGASSAIAFQTTATAGTLTGGSFTGHNFGTVNETLIVVVDGTSQSITLTSDMGVIGNAATDITALLSGATCTVSGSSPNQVLKITSASTGVGPPVSSIAITVSGSGSNALALFDADTGGTATTVDGVAASGANALALFNATTPTTGTDATSGTLTGNSFTAYDFTVIKNTWRWFKKDGGFVYGYQDGKVCYNECGKTPCITSESKYNTSSQHIEKKLSMRVGPSLTKEYESNMMQNGGCAYLM